MRCLVTGAAGFIGSHLSERLIAEGHEVLGVDCFTDFYERSLKEANVAALRQGPRFRLVEADLLDVDLAPLLDGVGVVFHQAAQPGVGPSFERFDTYVRQNVLVTQRLLEALRGAGVGRFVYASSSSVYGTAKEIPFRETTLPEPYSPYGVTKLAGEHLVELYRRNFGVSAISLRYFTVYGPRQRPDMALGKWLRAAMRGEPIVVYGDGEQTRDFTYVSDVVEANLRAAAATAVGVFNVGGGARVTVNAVLQEIEQLVGRPLVREHKPAVPGDMRHTWADTSALERETGCRPRVSVRDGLAEQRTWMSGGS